MAQIKADEITELLRQQIENFEQRIRSQSHAAALTDAQLAAKVGCPSLTVVSTRWVH